VGGRVFEACAWIHNGEEQNRSLRAASGWACVRMAEWNVRNGVTVEGSTAIVHGAAGWGRFRRGCFLDFYRTCFRRSQCIHLDTD
jgi:hypothetical protein